MNNIQAIANKLAAYFFRLKDNERRLLIIFVVVMIGMSYYRKVFLPLRQYGQEQSKILADAQLKLSVLQSNIPQIKEAKAQVQKLKDQQVGFKKELSRLESKMMASDFMSPLLGSLQGIAKNSSLEILEITPSVENKKIKGYVVATVKVVMNGGYQDIVNYVGRLEKFSPFLSVDGVKVDEDGKEGKRKITATLDLQALILNGPRTTDENAFDLKNGPLAKLSRDPFVPILTTKEGQEQNEAVLSGISFEGTVPTAIINNDVYRVGDKFGTQTVKDIQKGQVILFDGPKQVILKMTEN